MRGIGCGIVRFPAATAWIAGAAFLAGVSVPGARAGAAPDTPTEETALAVPRLAPAMGGLAGAPLPQPLAPSEAVLIRRVFAAQARGNIQEAARIAAGIDTGTSLGSDMLGHILADRHLGPYTRPGAPELRDWLDRWPDLPDAPAVRALFAVRLPKGATPPAMPVVATFAPQPSATVAADDPDAEREVLVRNIELAGDAAATARARGADGVERLIARTKGVDRNTAAALRGIAAEALFLKGDDDGAYRIGAAGVQNCAGGPSACPGASLAGFAAGLAAWRDGREQAARAMFGASWRAPGPAARKAAAAFWVGRADLREGARARATIWFRRAAEERRTFYGMVARRMLGLHDGLDPTREVLGEADTELLADTPEGLRAFALLQVGQAARAEAELRLLLGRMPDSRPLARAAMLVGERAGMIDFAAQVADHLSDDAVPRDALRFPVPKLRPPGGFRVDPALVLGIARAESNFDPELVSPAGAQGLMQIMPDTARFVIGIADDRPPRGPLHDPEVNLDVGQRYIRWLADNDPVNGDLLRLLASYNAGPAAVARWTGRRRDAGDPFLFLESIPVDETRAYVPRVLTYAWIYAARLRLPAPSLDELAAGAWPRYHPYMPAQAGRAH